MRDSCRLCNGPPPAYLPSRAPLGALRAFAVHPLVVATITRWPTLARTAAVARPTCPASMTQRFNHSSRDCYEVPFRALAVIPPFPSPCTSEMGRGRHQ